MDEVSKRKGYREFVTVVSDVEQGCLLEVIDSHKQQEIIATLKKQPFEVRAKVKEVSVDMSRLFENTCQVYATILLVVQPAESWKELTIKLS